MVIRISFAIFPNSLLNKFRSVMVVHSQIIKAESSKKKKKLLNFENVLLPLHQEEKIRNRYKVKIILALIIDFGG